MTCNKEKIAFIICTNDELWFEECKRYIDNLNTPLGFTVEILPIFDARGMANGYNKGRKQSDAKYKIYMHHDVFIINKNLIEDVICIFQNNPKIGIIGMVGANDIQNGKVSVGNWEYGKVLACSGYSEVYCHYGEVEGDYEQVDCVDGMFIATQYDIAWREELFQDWHFYDRSICMEYKRNGYISVVPKQSNPWCIHDCGINSLIGWKGDLKKFLIEYQDYFSESCIENSSIEEIDEDSRIELEKLGNSMEILVNNKQLKETFEVLQEFMELGMLPNKKIRFISEIMELYNMKATKLFFKEDDTVSTMLEKYVRAKFIFRRAIYGIEISEEETAFIKSLSETEQRMIIAHNLEVSLQMENRN